MTVLTTTAKAGPYAGSGTTGPFTVPFRFLDAAHLRVIRSVDSVETVLALGADYTVNGVGASSGSVTLLAPLPVGQSLTVVRNVPLTQEADYVPGDAFPAESHEQALDKLTMITQQLQEEVQRAAKLPASSPSDADALSVALLRVDANSSNINAVNANSANINAAVANSANINTVAANITDVTNFAGVYLGARSADPATRTNGSPLQAGDLYFNTAANQMRGYSGSGWTITAPATDANLVSYLPAGTGAVARTVQAKLRELPSVKDFSSPAIADATGSTLFVPTVGYSSGVAHGGALTARYWGPGQIVTADGNRRGKWFSAVTAAPASTGNHDSVDTAFNGDLSRSHFQIEHRVTGAATLGQPTTGYTYTPEVMPNYTYLYNASGWNQSTSGNAGRTGIAAYRAKVDQYGQGDAVAFNASVFVAGTRAGSTHWLANPAGVLFNGDMTAGANGVYFNPRELFLDDAGYDVAAIGDVINMKRTNDTGAKSAVWTAARYQSIGTKPVDNIISAVGRFTVGLDFSMTGLDFGTNKAAISLKAGDRIYLNNAATASGQLTADWRTTVFNGDYIDYSSGGMNFVVGGSNGLRVSTTEVYASKRVKMLQSFDVVSSGNIASTVGAAGVASPLPAAPVTYLIVKLDGTNYKIPVYNA